MSFVTFTLPLHAANPDGFFLEEQFVSRSPLVPHRFGFERFAGVSAAKLEHDRLGGAKLARRSRLNFCLTGLVADVFDASPHLKRGVKVAFHARLQGL